MPVKGKGVVLAVKELSERYLAEDLASNIALGNHGAQAIARTWGESCPSGFNLMTICNTGSLATAGHGTALGIVRSLHSEGRLGSLGNQKPEL